MSLYELRLKSELQEKQLNFINNKIKLLEVKATKVTKELKDITVKSSGNFDNTKIIDEIIELKDQREELKKEMLLVKNYTEELEEVFEKFEETEKLIYIDFYFRKQTAVFIAMKYGCSERKIYYTLSKINGMISL